MLSSRPHCRLLGAAILAVLPAALVSCESYPWLPGFQRGDEQVVETPDGLLYSGSAFTESLLQGRTFTHGTSVTTVTYAVGDLQRTPLDVDFNDDGRVDPVLGYGATQAVIQILLSRGVAGTVNPLSLTLDSKRDMENLADVAVGDIDNDGYLDIVAAAEEAVWYFHHPSSGVTTHMRAWGNQDPNDTLYERIDASYQQFTDNELLAMVTQAVGPGVNLDDYIITIEHLYTNVEIADFDNDGDSDIAASRRFVINLTPRPDRPVEPIQIVDGDVMVFTNPGAAVDGHGWTLVSVGRHERQGRLDRDGASGLLVCDLDGDGWLDLLSSAREDNNVQIAWFRNPGPPLETENPWTQYRIGSVRDAWALDLGDVTGDGWPDVVATGGEQMQMMLFEHPGRSFPSSRYEYDWETSVIVTFQAYEPRDVKMLDLDNDGVLELVVGGTEGAVRYFERPANPHDAWEGHVITNFVVEQQVPADPNSLTTTADDLIYYTGSGTVGLLGYGDLDNDGDLDLVAVLDSDDENESRAIWIRNDLAIP